MKTLLVKALLVLSVFFMMITYFNKHHPLNTDVETFRITQIYGDEAAFLKTGRKMSKKIVHQSDGSFMVTLNKGQKKAWKKAYTSSINSIKATFCKQNPQNSLKISHDYQRIQIKSDENSLSTLSLYMPQMIMCCEILQVLEKKAWQVDVTLMRTAHRKVVKAHYPGELPSDLIMK